MKKLYVVFVGLFLLCGQVASAQNYSLDFESGQYARIPMSESLSGFDEFTMECWYYQIAFDGGDERIVGLEPANSTTGSYQINVSGGGDGAYSASIGDGTNWLSCVHVQAVAPQNWTHLAITYDGITFRFFINGDLIYSEDGYVNAFGPPDQDLVINRHTWDGGNSWSSRLTGHLDELRISSIARYTAPFTPPCNQFGPDEYTMGLWHFNEGSGSSIIDESPYGNHGVQDLPVIWMSYGYQVLPDTQLHSPPLVISSYQTSIRWDCGTSTKEQVARCSMQVQTEMMDQ